MSDLRDARLQRALEHAPDDAGAPSAAVAEAIRQHARRALEADRALDARRPPWWRTLWRASGSRAGPWNAAFATVVLAGFVTLLWQGRDLPGADPQEVPLTVPPPPPMAAPAPAPAAKADAERRPDAQAPVPSEARREPAANQSAAPRAQRAPDAIPAAPPAPAPVGPSAVAEAQSRAAEADSRTRAEAATGAARDSAARGAVAPAPALAAPAAPPRAASIARASTPSWDSVRITREGQSIELGRDAAERLAVLVRTVIETARPVTADAPAGATPSLRIELRAGADVETVELTGDAVRWSRRSGGMASAGSGSADGASAEALRAEVARSAPR